MSGAINEILNTNIMGSYDVIVCGGGPAGIGAAVAASRKGMRTLLIEQYGFLGGMWTAGLVNPLFDTDNKTGLVRELVDNLKEKQAWGAFWDICFDIETMKHLLDELTQEAGVDVLFHTCFSRPILVGNIVKGVIVENKGGRMAFEGAIVIDCTGDGDVAARCGAEIKIGREEDGETQAMTLMFLLGNIDYLQQEPHELYEMMRKAVENNDTGYKIDYNCPYVIKLPIGRYAVVQLTHIRGKCALNPFDLSNAEQIGRKMVMDTYKFFKKYIPEFKDIDLITTAPHMGIRETRRIVGEYTLTYEDILSGEKFEDGIVDVTFGIDIHNSDSTNQSVEKIKPYQIPYRCLIPKGLKNILVAGRCISGDFMAHASYRVTGNCLAMGENAGYAAAQAITKNIDVRDINVKEILI